MVPYEEKIETAAQCKKMFCLKGAALAYFEVYHNHLPTTRVGTSATFFKSDCERTRIYMRM